MRLGGDDTPHSENLAKMDFLRDIRQLGIAGFIYRGRGGVRSCERYSIEKRKSQGKILVKKYLDMCFNIC